MRGLIERRRKALRSYLLLLSRAPRATVAAALLVQTVAGLSAPLVIIGMGVALDAALSGIGRLWVGVVLCGIGLVLQQSLAPVQVWTGEEVMRAVDRYASRRLMGSAGGTVNLRLLEQPAVVADVRDASESLAQASFTPGGACAGSLGLVSRYVTLAGAVVLLALVTSPLIGLLGFAVALVNRLGQTIGFSQWSAVIRRRAPSRRRLNYLRQLATDPVLARDVRKLRLSGWIEDRYRSEARRYLGPLWWARRRLLGRRFVGYAAATLILGTVLLWLGSRDLMADGVSAGQLAIMLQAVAVCVLFGVIFPESDTKMQYGLSAWDAIERVETALATSTAACEPVAAPDRTGATRDGQAAVALLGVGFEYRPGTPVLDGVDLVLPAGRSTAVVGVNGAGKSTLVKIAAGFYRPTSGRVVVDGVELTPSGVSGWQRQIAVLYQDYLTYQLSFRENVTMQSVSPGSDDQLVESCLDEVGLASVLDRCPAGIDTPLSRLMVGGTDLSGGQWQRLALARALYAVRTGARLLVLDEPTSQMDARGEAEFYERFLEMTRGVTTLVISHRFSSVRRADSIAVLDGGVITEHGDHEQLVRLGGTYARMFTAQAERYGR